MTTYRLMDGASGRPGVSSSGTQPPASGTAYSGNYSAGLVFKVTSGGLYFNGYWWWVPASGGDTSPGPDFSLWQVTGTNQGQFLPGTMIAWNANTLTAGAWNFIPCVPVPLTPNVPYIAVIAYAGTHGYPSTASQFGSGNPYSGGITNGPLHAYGFSTGAGTATTGSLPQSPQVTGSAQADAAFYLPTSNVSNSLLWLDVQVTDQVPPVTPERAWANLPQPWPAATQQSAARTLGMKFTLANPAGLNRIWHYVPTGTATGNYTAWQGITPTGLSAQGTGPWTFGMEFEVSTSCFVTKIWNYSGTGAGLPQACAIYASGNTTPLEVQTSPSWSGSGASGWVSATLSGTTQVNPGTVYYVALYYNGNVWNFNTYWGASGTGAVNGPLSVPGPASAANGQGVIHSGGTGITYPEASWSSNNAWMDVTVTPSNPGALPSRVAIFDDTLHTAVAGTDNASPAWKNPDGSTATGPGWAYCDYTQSGITLAAGTYRAAAYSSAGKPWYAETASVFSSGLQASGFTQDALAIPGGSTELQYDASGSFAYPGTSAAGAADWMDVDITPVPASSYRLMDGAAGRPGSGPSTAVTSATNFIAGVAFEMLRGGYWFYGYWYWVCPTGGVRQAQKFALWSHGHGDNGGSGSTGTLVPSTTITSGTLASGWNYVPLSAPVQLAPGFSYIAATGVNGNFAESKSGTGTGAADGYGTGGHATGIRNGPLFAYSGTAAEGGQSANPWGTSNGLFSTAGTDPAATMPGTADSAANFWMDVQVSATPPSGYSGSYRIWPNVYQANLYTAGDAAVNYVIGTEFHLNQPCSLSKIWYYSPTGTAQLATSASIWNIDTGTKVAGNTSPSWSGAAASGWVSTSFSGVTLGTGRYYVTVYNGAATPDSWGAKQFFYWLIGDVPYNWPGSTVASTGPPFDGIVNGPLNMPSLSNASAIAYYNQVPNAGSPGPGQAIFATGPPEKFPNQYVKGLGQTYYVDIEVVPLTVSATATLAGTGSITTPPEGPAGIKLLTGTGSVSTAARLGVKAVLSGTGALGTPPANKDITVFIGPTASRAQAAAGPVQGDGKAAGTVRGDGKAIGATQNDGKTIGPTNLNRGR